MGGGNEFDSINSGVSGFNELLDGSATPIGETRPPLIPIFLSRQARENPTAREKPEYLALTTHHLHSGGFEAVHGRNRSGGSSSPATAGPPTAQTGVSNPVRAHHGDNSASIRRQVIGRRGGPGALPASSGFLHVPLSRIAVHLVKSLSRSSAHRSGGLGLYGSYWIRKVPPTALPCTSAWIRKVDHTAASAAAPAISRRRISPPQSRC